MKRFLQIFLFVLASPVSSFAVQVQISSTQIPNWRGGSVCSARVYASDSFTDSLGIRYIGGAVGSQNFFQTVTGTVAGTVCTLPSFTLPSTVDSIDRPSVRYTIALYDSKGTLRGKYLTDFAVPAVTPTTWANIILYNNTSVPAATIGYYTSAQTGTLLAGLSTALKASDVLFGKVILSAAPTDVTKPVAVGDNDARVSSEIYADKFATFALALADARITGGTRTTLVVASDEPVAASVTVPAHVSIRMTNTGKFTVASRQTLTIQGAFDAPPIEVFAGAGSVNLTSAKIKEIYPDWFAPSNTIDWSAAIVKASKAAVSQGGNTVKFVCGKSYTVATPIDLGLVSGYFPSNMKWVGCASDYEGDVATLVYTGTGGSSAFNFKSSYGNSYKNIVFKYTKAGFTGVLVDVTHSATGQDSAYLTFESCTFTGTSTAYNATLLAIDGSIISRFEKNHFLYGENGLRGMSAGSAGDYSNVITVKENSFNFVRYAILNPSSNWTIDTNTFEPNRENKNFVIANNCGNSCQTAAGSTFVNNYIGDSLAQTEPFVKFVKARGLTIQGNWWASENGTSRAAITLDGVEGAQVTGNYAGYITNFIETTGVTSYDVHLSGNKIFAATIVLQTVPLIGLTYNQGLAFGNFFDKGLTVHGNMIPRSDLSSIDFGYKTSQDNNTSGQIAILDSGFGSSVTNRSLGIFAPVNSDAEINFFTSNTRRAFVNGGGFNSLVPVTAHSGSSRFPTALTVLPSTHAASRRAGIVLDNWAFGQDLSGNGTKDFYLYQSSARAARMYFSAAGNLALGSAADNGVDKLQVTGSASISGITKSASDVYVTNNTRGIILKSPDNTCYRFTVANGGALSSGAAVTCP